MEELYDILVSDYYVESTHDNAIFKGVQTPFWYYNTFDSVFTGTLNVANYTQPLITLSNTGTKLTVNGEEVVVKSEIDALKAELAELKKKLNYE